MAVASSTPCSRVELSISCANLQDKDVFSKSDPIVVLYVKDKTADFVEVSRVLVRVGGGSGAVAGLMLCVAGI